MSSFRFSRQILRPFALVMALGVLAACTSTDEADKAQAALGCPGASILGGTEHITQFKAGDGRDLIDVMFEADIRNIGSGCKQLKGRIVSEVSFELVATRGPAAESREGNFIYFVAVTNAAGRVLAKETFDTTIAFAANRRRAGTIELTEQSIPLPAGATSANFEILIGFQLTPDQLKYNRRK